MNDIEPPASTQASPFWTFSLRYYRLAEGTPNSNRTVDLAAAYAAQRKTDKASEALIWYEKVEERNPTFRDVALRIERLGVKKSAQQEVDEFDQMFDDMIVKE